MLLQMLLLWFFGWVIFHCIYTPHLLYPFLCWWTSGGFHVLTTVYTATINIWIHVSFQIMIFTRYMPRRRIAGSFISVQSLSHVQLFVIPWTAAHQASLFITNSRSLLKLISIESVMSYNHLIFVIPFSFHLQSFTASGSSKWVTSSHQVAKVLEFQHQSFHWIFRMDFP